MLRQSTCAKWAPLGEGVSSGLAQEGGSRRSGRRRTTPPGARVLALAIVAVPRRLLGGEAHLTAGSDGSGGGGGGGDGPRGAREEAGLAEVLADVRACAVFAAPSLDGGGAGWEAAGPRVRVGGTAEAPVDERDAAGGGAREGAVGGRKVVGLGV